MRRFAALTVLLACGCTPMQWYREDASLEQFQSDERECRNAAWREANYHAWHYQSMLGPAVARDATGRPFVVYPASPLVDPYGYQMMEESRLTQFCMEAKGYKLVPVPRQ
jgi:hypothetical protein